MSFSDNDLRRAFDLDQQETMRFEVVESFRSRQRWLLVLVAVMTVLMTGVSLWSALQFFQIDADDTRGLLAYMALFLWTSFGVSFLKSWYLARLDRNAVRRDIRRLELLIEQFHKD